MSPADDNLTARDHVVSANLRPLSALFSRETSPMKFTLRTKLFALTVFMVTVIMATVTFLLTVRQVEGRRLDAQAGVARLADTIATFPAVERQDWTAYQVIISRLMRANQDVVFIAVYDDRDALRAYTLNPELVEIDETILDDRRMVRALVRSIDDGGVAEESRGDLHVARVNIVTESGERVLGHVHVGLSLIPIKRQLRHGIRQNTLLAVGFFVLSGLAAFVLSRRLTGPIERLNVAMSRIAAGELDVRVQAEARDEIGELAHSFNEMAVGLGERRVIDQLGRELGGTFQLERLLELVRTRLCNALGADATRMFLRRGNGRKFSEEIGAPATDCTIESELCSGLEQSPEGVAVASTPAPLRAALRAVDLGDDELLLPLLVQDRALGFLSFRFACGAETVSAERRRFARTLASQAALALDNALLYGELREQERLKGELELARKVQRKLLPRSAPEIRGFALAGTCVPAHEVGGDYYDFFRLRDGKLGAVIADVSGKGASAALYMAELKGMMLSLAMLNSSPRSVLIELNKILYPSLERHVFASVLYAVLDPANQTVTFARAGHPPLIKLDGNCRHRALVTRGIALGLDHGPLFEKTIDEDVLDLAPGEALVMYTDGITDAMNPAGDSFGLERLLEVLCRPESPMQMQQNVIDAVRTFTSDAPQFDDLTIVTVLAEPTA